MLIYICIDTLLAWAINEWFSVWDKPKVAANLSLNELSLKEMLSCVMFLLFLIFKGPDNQFSQSVSYYEQWGPTWSQFLRFRCLCFRQSSSRWFWSGWDFCDVPHFCAPMRRWQHLNQTWWQLWVVCLCCHATDNQNGSNHTHTVLIKQISCV